MVTVVSYDRQRTATLQSKGPRPRAPVKTESRLVWKSARTWTSGPTGVGGTEDTLVGKESRSVHQSTTVGRGRGGLTGRDPRTSRVPSDRPYRETRVTHCPSPLPGPWCRPCYGGMRTTTPRVRSPVSPSGRRTPPMGTRPTVSRALLLPVLVSVSLGLSAR